MEIDILLSINPNVATKLSKKPGADIVLRAELRTPRGFGINSLLLNCANVKNKTACIMLNSKIILNGVFSRNCGKNSFFIFLVYLLQI